MSIDNELAFEAELVVLMDDDGNEHEFEIIDEIETDDGYFMALIPTLRGEEDIADADEYYIFELVNIDGEEQLSEVEDDDLLDKLAEIFETRYAQSMEDDEDWSDRPGDDHPRMNTDNDLPGTRTVQE